MKKSVLLSLMVIFCLTSHVVFSVLSDSDKDLLIELIKARRVANGYWPEHVHVKVTQFAEEPRDNDSDARYHVRFEGYYLADVTIIGSTGDTEDSIGLFRRGTEGHYTKTELESFGIALSE